MNQTMLTRADHWTVVSIMARIWARRPGFRSATDGRDFSLLQIPELPEYNTNPCSMDLGSKAAGL